MERLPYRDARLARRGEEKPLPADLSHHYSEVTKHRVASQMKAYYKFFQIPGIGNLAGGLPNVRFFPFDTLEAQTAKPERWTPSPNQPDASGATTTQGPSDPQKTAAHIEVPKISSEPDPLKKIDLATALQYGLAQGYPSLLSWIRQFTRDHLHPDVPYRDGPDVMLTCGSTDGFSKTLELFVNPWSGEAGDDICDRPGLLCETFVYGNILTQALPKGMQVVTVESDAAGMVATGRPGSLEDVLSNWDPAKGKRPHLMYTVAMGHNPTGIVVPIERKRDIYAICSKYDVIIVEDEPYWYLQFPSADMEEAKSRGGLVLAPPPPSVRAYRSSSSGYPFLDSMVPSFLSMDVDGRVVRLDTFSKTIAPGCRLGWITAQPGLIERYVRISETSTQQPSGFVQSMVAELVMGGPDTSSTSSRSSLFSSSSTSTSTRDKKKTPEGWKMDGWVRWLEGLRGMYERRMNRMCRILDEGSYQIKTKSRFGNIKGGGDEWDDDCVLVSKTQLYEYDWPRGGMFVWLRIRFETHPLWQALDGVKLSAALMIYLTTKPYLVLVAPGTMFSANDKVRVEKGWAFFRLCFAGETEENVDGSSQRFVDGVQRFWTIKDTKEIEKLLEDLPFTAQGQHTERLDVGGTWLGC
ncbi:aromatic amino acid aminotransferase [Diplogelasinospora grovesii]|uniref:Aromatic amino acid aminotransferase n=1 Tax=Diplogelasinospora grovesii TaxID=303347 RepID=A0AAN6S8Q8_9PEZI|nr:aromatic amino acid aminotransferase [Diplogelasinospora grovesii]